MLVESDLGAGVRKAVAEVDRRDRVRTAGENFIASLLSFISCYDAIGCCGWSAVQLKGNVDKIDISTQNCCGVGIVAREILCLTIMFDGFL